MQVQIIISEAKCGNLKINRQKYHPPQMLRSSTTNAAMGLSLPLCIHWCCYFFKNQAAMGLSLPLSWLLQKNKVTDGSIELNIQELKTISHYQLNIKTFVINNGSYVSMQKWQDDYFDKNRLDTSTITGVGTLNFKNMAKAFDLNYLKIKKISDIKEKIKIIQKDRKPYLIEVITDPNQKIYGQKF